MSIDEDAEYEVTNDEYNQLNQRISKIRENIKIQRNIIELKKLDKAHTEELNAIEVAFEKILNEPNDIALNEINNSSELIELKRDQFVALKDKLLTIETKLNSLTAVSINKTKALKETTKEAGRALGHGAEALISATLTALSLCAFGFEGLKAGTRKLNQTINSPKPEEKETQKDRARQANKDSKNEMARDMGRAVDNLGNTVSAASKTILSIGKMLYQGAKLGAGIGLELCRWGSKLAKSLVNELGTLPPPPTPSNALGNVSPSGDPATELQSLPNHFNP